MAKYLVTGGAGFIGCNVVHELVRRGHKVVVLDDLSTGSLDNLESVKTKISLIEGSVVDVGTVRRAVRGMDYVLHQAALRAVERSVDNPRATNDANITGTLNVLLAARDAKVKRVVFASSSSVYGDIKESRQVESLVPQPTSPYALSKLAGEHYCRLFSELYGLETVCLRYFNVFGPHQSPESKYSALIPILVKQLRAGRTPTIHWSGHQSRDFTFVANVVQANLKAATGKRVKLGEVYNIGNGENISVNDLYQELQKLLGTAIKPKRAAKRAGDVFRTFADIRKAKRDFDYVPNVSFREGLMESIEWYKENR